MHPCLARSMYDYDCISLLGAQHVWLWLYFLAWRSAYMIMTDGTQCILAWRSAYMIMTAFPCLALSIYDYDWWYTMHPCLARSMYDYDCISLLGAQHIWLWLHSLAWRAACMIMTAFPCLARSIYDYDCIDASLLGAQHVWLWLMVQDASLLGAQHIWLWLHFLAWRSAYMIMTAFPCLALSIYDYDCILAWRAAYMIMTAFFLLSNLVQKEMEFIWNARS